VERFATKCRSSYKSGAFVTVDEQLVTFRGRCPFKMFIPNKPGKYGIKIWVLADSHNSYCCNLQVYTGRRGNDREIGQGSRVVLELTEHLSNTGRHITGDNFFTNLVLVRSLLSRQLTYNGTLRKNKGEIPKEMLPTRQRATSSSIFGFQQDTTLVSYVPKRGKAVILLSSLHHDNECAQDETKKPQIILDYNQMKSGVDTLDQVVRCYSVKRKTNRWPFALFCNLVDMAAYNSFVLFTHLHPEYNRQASHRRRVFLVELASQLLPVQAAAVPAAGAVGGGGPMRPGKRRCHLCARGIDRKVSQQCERCGCKVCNEHCHRVCDNCN